MKLSLSWICDHLKIDQKDINVEHLIKRLNQTTAEIEAVAHVKIKVDSFHLVRILSIEEDKIIAQNVENDEKIVLDLKKDFIPGQMALIFKENDKNRWATLQDFGSERTDLVAPVFVPDEKLSTWRDLIEKEDYILELDNKSINHRPDLWGHRGFAREVAAILNVKMVPEESICTPIEVQSFEKASSKSQEMPFELAIKDSVKCKRLAALYCSEIENTESNIWITSRLARLDARSIRTIVDLTNYVMFDMGQPLHAFDADKIAGEKLIADKGDGRTLELLDGQEIQTISDEIVIYDGKSPLALGGLMGGISTVVDDKTSCVLLESANFEPHTIRRASLRIKKRTEASTRFEKSLDPNQNTAALQRYIKLFTELNLSVKSAKNIISLGDRARKTSIELNHEVIEKKLGFEVSPEFIKNTLERLGFGVLVLEQKYSITVPTYRGTKDITIKEDVIEEIGRFLEYNPEECELPYRQTTPFDTRPVYQKRKIKNLLSNALLMHEVYNYNLYDQDFLKKLKYAPAKAIFLKNPVSQNMQVLVESLIPNLIKNVTQNETKVDEARFFELAYVWDQVGSEIVESKKLAGVFWQQSKIDFYEFKSLLLEFFHGLQLSIEWVKQKSLQPWWSENQTAALMIDGRCIGFAGKVDQKFLSSAVQGQAFIFEVDADFLLSYKPKQKHFTPIGKYQSVHLDVSLFAPLAVTVKALEDVIISSDDRIYVVELIDFYEKDEWLDKRSLTFRYFVQDLKKTMTKHEIEQVMKKVQVAVEGLKGIVR